MIANARNRAGVATLGNRLWRGAVSSMELRCAALMPSIVAGLALLVL
ncbi:putative Na+/H+ antiporter [Paraburkholderia strydomiana]|nr:putative Na+/H+ antiporter [Paraburkholderia strydomiana]